MMALARFFFTWILGFGDTTPASAGPDVIGGSDVSLSALTLFSGAAIGIALIGFRMFDGITDPLAGMVSDLWVRGGRQRRSLLWFTIFIPSIGLALCFSPTHAMDPGTRWLLLAAGMFVFFIGYTFYAIPYWSLIEDYGGNNANERRVLSNLLGAGLVIATAIAGLASPLLVESFGYSKAALIFAIPAAVLMTLPYFAAPNGTRSSAPEIPKRRTSLFVMLIDAFRHLVSKFEEKGGLEIIVETKTIQQRIAEIIRFLKENRRADFIQVCRRDRSKAELILSFLAVLELARVGVLRLFQHQVTRELTLFLMEEAKVYNLSDFRGPESEREDEDDAVVNQAE